MILRSNVYVPECFPKHLYCKDVSFEYTQRDQKGCSSIPMGKFKLVKQMFSLAMLNRSLTLFFFFFKPSAICNPHYYCCFVKNMWFQERENGIAPKGLQLMAEGHTAALLFVHRWITQNASSGSMFKQTTSRSNWLFNRFYFWIVPTLSFPVFLPVFTGPAGTGFVFPLRSPEALVSIIISQNNHVLWLWWQPILSYWSIITICKNQFLFVFYLEKT